MPSVDLTPEDIKVAIYLELSTMRKEYHRVHGAVCFLNPNNTITTLDFEEAYFKIRDLLEQCTKAEQLLAALLKAHGVHDG